jgi:5-methylthioadenosine/S-adenosylhomocysteine deaminase
MRESYGLSRRGFLGTAAATGAAGLVAGPAAAESRGGGHGHRGPGRGGRLPRRADFVIRGAHVLSMDPEIGDLAWADVHVRKGRIAAVGKGLRGSGRVIDGRNSIVLPGLVDTHWHTWTTLYRSLAGSAPENGYFALNLRNGPAFEPVDYYRGVRLALADAVWSGITTVHDWSHNIRAPAFADANLQALVDSGVRGRFSYGTPQGRPANQTIDLADFQRVHEEWFESGRADLIHLGLAGRPPGLSPESVFRSEYELARSLGLPVSYHANSNRAQGAAQMIQKLGDEGMLGPHTQLIHALFTTASERALVAGTGAWVSVSPWSELLIGYGVTPIHEMVEAGMPLNLSVDTLPLTGTADMFSIMRLTTGLKRGQAEDEFAITARRVLEMATIDGARGLGLGEVTGSLTPGKRADLIMVRTDDLNIAPFTDPVNMIVLAAQPHNVDLVAIDGRILKRHGELTALDPERVVRQAAESLAAVLARVGPGTAARVSKRERELAPCC